tara:strand:- start:284 stop:550 length:267 start_codon:yes stop_codon:yes gene_type:complete
VVRIRKKISSQKKEGGGVMGRVKAWMMDREERAADRGSADRYYGRQPEPHIWLDNIGRNVVAEVDMTEGEVDAYFEGWRNEEDRKDWG